MPTAGFEHVTDYFPGVSASPDMSAKQYYAVYMPSDTQVTLPNGSASEHPIGVLQNEPGSGMTAQVAYVKGDICKLLCNVSSNTIQRWDPVFVDSNAQGIYQETAGCPYFARALVSTTASGVIPVILTGTNTLRTASAKV